MFRFFFTFLKQSVHGKRIRYRIVSVNTELQEVSLQMKNKAKILTLGFSEVVKDREIIQSMFPVETCWIGGYYGRTQESQVELKGIEKMTFLLSTKKGRYKMVFDNRDGRIGYFDKKTKQEFVEHPITLVKNENIISGFDPSQACYIGILAGRGIEKAQSENKCVNEVKRLMDAPPALRLVK